MVTEHTPYHRVAELYFVQGVLSYCKAEAIMAGYLSDAVRCFSVHLSVLLLVCLCVCV